MEIKQTFVQVKRRIQAENVESVSFIKDLIGASIIGEQMHVYL